MTSDSEVSRDTDTEYQGKEKLTGDYTQLRLGNIERTTRAMYFQPKTRVNVVGKWINGVITTWQLPGPVQGKATVANRLEADLQPETLSVSKKLTAGPVFDFLQHKLRHHPELVDPSWTATTDEGKREQEKKVKTWLGSLTVSIRVAFMLDGLTFLCWIAAHDLPRSKVRDYTDNSADIRVSEDDAAVTKAISKVMGVFLDLKDSHGRRMEARDNIGGPGRAFLDEAYYPLYNAYREARMQAMEGIPGESWWPSVKTAIQLYNRILNLVTWNLRKELSSATSMEAQSLLESKLGGDKLTGPNGKWLWSYARTDMPHKSLPAMTEPAPPMWARQLDLDAGTGRVAGEKSTRDGARTKRGNASDQTRSRWLLKLKGKSVGEIEAMLPQGFTWNGPKKRYDYPPSIWGGLRSDQRAQVLAAAQLHN